MARLMYGTGMRLTECIRLRVLDLDFAYKQIIVRDAKGKKDRGVPIPDKLASNLQEQILKVKARHDEDLKAGFGSVFLPHALARKYPSAENELRWFDDVSTTMIYLHVVGRGGQGVKSPLDIL